MLWINKKRNHKNHTDQRSIHQEKLPKKNQFDDTNAMFVKPKKFDFHVTSQDAKTWAPLIAEKIK